MKILIVMPAHNEARMLKRVLSDVKKKGFKDILVVDDGSTDKTFQIAKQSRAKVVRHVVNRGLGAGLGTGFEYARRHDYDILVTFDADGQHKSDDIPRLLAKQKANSLDVVIGSRLLGKKDMPLKIRFLNFASNLITFILYQVWTTDSLSGLRCFNKVAIEKIDIRTDRMEVSNEFFKEIRKNKLRFGEIPIQAVYTDYSKAHSHQVSAFNVGLKMIFRLFR